MLKGGSFGGSGVGSLSAVQLPERQKKIYKLINKLIGPGSLSQRKSKKSKKKVTL